MPARQQPHQDAIRRELHRQFNRLTPATRRMFLAVYDAGGEHGISSNMLASFMGKRQLAPYDREKLRMLVQAGFLTAERRDTRILIRPRPGTQLTYGAHFEWVYTIPPGLVEKPKPRSAARGLIARITDVFGNWG